MQNAFELLGATPLDNGEKLKELFEEKQLLLDNDKELAEAYSALTNPKKRIKHEIEYFAKEEFESFNEIFVENTDSEQKMNLHDTCSAIINIGRWFDSEVHSIYTQINDNREISGFSKLNNNGAVSTAINEIRANCVSSVTKYFEFIDEKALVKLFNELVEYENFSSFFMDELMAHYEIKITESLQAKQKICTSKFEEVERRCNNFNNGGVFSSELDERVTEFKKALTSWDKLAQPLQVNAQQHGATHEGSIAFVRNIRNKVIDFSNESQESLTKTLQSVQYTYNAKETFTQKLTDSVAFADIIIKLLDILKNAFAEDELTADRLKKDKQDIAGLKKTLQELLNKFDPYGRYKSTSMIQPQSSSLPSRSTGSYRSSGDSRKTVGIVIAVIIGFFMLMAIISGIVNSNPNGKEFAVTFDKQGGNGGSYSVTAIYGDTMPSATAPTRSGYDFMGYFTSTNGGGTQYYDSLMESVWNWDKNRTTTLYASWIRNPQVTLSKDNFSDYFTLTCSVISSSNFTFKYTIQKKSNVVVDDSWSSDTISVTLYCKVGEGNTFTVTLSKSNDYYLSSSRVLTASKSFYSYFDPVGYVTACSGQVFVN